MNVKNILAAIIICSFFLQTPPCDASVLSDALTLLKNKLTDLSSALAGKNKQPEFSILSQDNLIKLSEEELTQYIKQLEVEFLKKPIDELYKYYEQLLTVDTIHPMVKKLHDNIDLSSPENPKELFSHKGFLTLIGEEEELKTNIKALKLLKKALAKILLKKKNGPYQSVVDILYDTKITTEEKITKLVNLKNDSFKNLLKRKIFQLESENQKDGWRCGYFTAFNGALAFKQALLGKNLAIEPPAELNDEKKLFANELKKINESFPKNSDFKDNVRKAIVKQLWKDNSQINKDKEWLSQYEVGLLFNIFLYTSNNVTQYLYDKNLFTIKSTDNFYCYSTFDGENKMAPIGNMAITGNWIANIILFQKTGIPQMIPINVGGHWIACIMTVNGLFIIDSLNHNYTENKHIQDLYDIYVGKSDFLKRALAQSVKNIKKASNPAKSYFGKINVLLKALARQKPLSYPNGTPLTW